ncbi:RapZ C-terminal domain-containing protein, partial [Bacillus sp. HC-Mk]
GCTGGQHRSVTLTEYLGKHLKPEYSVHVSHRDVEKRKGH